MTAFALDRAELALARGHRPLIVDLGTSRGTQVQRLATELEDRARFLACDVSDSMLEAAGSDLRGLLSAGTLELRHHDLRNGRPS